MQNEKLKCGIIGATGMVGQRFVTLLADHPYFEISVLAASSRSAGKTYGEAVEGRWKLSARLPESVKNIVVQDASEVEKIASQVDFVFCAVNMDKSAVLSLEESYAKAETPVVSNNSANRWTKDVPMVIPEINSAHFAAIELQKRRLGTKNGFIVAKPNCSIQSFVPVLTPLLNFGITKVSVTTFQAVSGAGRTLKSWPAIHDNVIPFIGGEEEKTETEPLKIWGSLTKDGIRRADVPTISAQCIRVPVSDGHLAAVSVAFSRIKPAKEEMIDIWRGFTGEPQRLSLPSAPKRFIRYFDEIDRPQTGLDRCIENGMGIAVGRLRNDPVFDYKFVCLSHNTLRGAAGGGVLTAELLYKKGYIQAK